MARARSLVTLSCTLHLESEAMSTWTLRRRSAKMCNLQARQLLTNDLARTRLPALQARRRIPHHRLLRRRLTLQRALRIAFA